MQTELLDLKRYKYDAESREKRLSSRVDELRNVNVKKAQVGGIEVLPVSYLVAEIAEWVRLQRTM
jgi:hypothetical protein